MEALRPLVSRVFPPYTAVMEPVERAASLLVHNKKLKERVDRLLIDI
jgi:hypothetical protein